MGKRSWTVGAASECDVVVNEPTVSGRHCRFLKMKDGFVLEDLSSTNGTYVNGERVTHPRRVQSSDRITLGTSTELPWPDHLLAPGSRTVRIGSDPKNDVVITAPDASRHHAQLTLHDGIMTLEDLGSDSGTGVGGPDHSITRSTVQPTDTIFFGSTAIKVASLIDALKKGVKVTLSNGKVAHDGPETTGPKISSETRTLIYVALGGAIVMAALIVTILLSVGIGENPQLADGKREVAATDEGGDPAIRSKAAASGHNAQGDRAKPAQQEKSSGTSSTGQTRSTSETGKKSTDAPVAPRPVDSLFLVLIGGEKPDREESSVEADLGDKEPAFYRVGTAWAVGPRTLASSASVVMRMQADADRFPQLVAFSPSMNRMIPITGSKVHPEYLKAADACDTAEQVLEALRASDASEPLSESQIGAYREKWIEARMNALKAAEKQVYYDVATITVAEDVGAPLELAPLATSDELRVNQAVRAVGFAFDFRDPLFNPDRATRPWTLEGRVEKTERFDEHDSSPQRLSVYLDPQPNQVVRGQLQFAYVGSPVLNGQDQVIAVYSRPSMPQDLDTPPDGLAFDSALVRRLREILTLDSN